MPARSTNGPSAGRSTTTAPPTPASAPGDGEVGGLNATGAPGPGGPLVLLYSDDLDATVTAVETAGGTITARPYEFPGGRRFEFSDPSGNVLGVWSTS